MAIRRKNSGFFKQDAIVGQMNSQKRASSTDAVAQCKSAVKYLKEPKKEEVVRFSMRFLTTGK
jgi:hypothetical protein